jgi:hypothetical protein
VVSELVVGSDDLDANYGDITMEFYLLLKEYNWRTAGTLTKCELCADKNEFI